MFLNEQCLMESNSAPVYNDSFWHSFCKTISNFIDSVFSSAISIFLWNMIFVYMSFYRPSSFMTLNYITQFRRITQLTSTSFRIICSGQSCNNFFILGCCKKKLLNCQLCVFSYLSILLWGCFWAAWRADDECL